MPFQNWQRIWQILTQELASHKNLHLMASFWPKYVMFEPEKYREVIFHDTRVWCKIWRKAGLWFGKWHEEFGKFSLEHTKFSKLGHLLDPFIQSRKCLNLGTEELCTEEFKSKKYRGVMFDYTQDWYKVWRKTGFCCF